MRPLYTGYGSWGLMKDEYAVVVTFGLSLLMINLFDKVIGPYPMRGPALWDVSRLSVGPFMMSGQKVVTAVLAIELRVGLAWVIKRSLWGRANQAVAQHRQ